MARLLYSLQGVGTNISYDVTESHIVTFRHHRSIGLSMLTFVISFVSRPGQVAPASWHPSLTGQLQHFLPLQNSKFSLTKEQVLVLIDNAVSIRDKAIIALATESGLRVSELASIELDDIHWDNKVVRILGKGQKEAYAPFGGLTEQYLRAWLQEYKPSDNIWGIGKDGVQTMLRRLQEKTGLPCNPHTFRRTFACLLRKAGVDTMTIKDLGRWESLEMVQRYTRSVSFEDSLRFYKAPLS